MLFIFNNVIKSFHTCRHRWTGRYEAHLWDNSCRKEGQTRKGRQGKLFTLLDPAPQIFLEEDTYVTFFFFFCFICVCIPAVLSSSIVYVG